MPDFITKAQLKSSIEQKDGSIDKIIALAAIEIAKIVKKRNEFESSVFISHSHKNSDLVEYFVALFSKINVEVYVDWMDDELTYPPTGKTALKIKEMINSNKKFILLATNEGIKSKWCNWELGIGDARKYIENIALLPVADNSGDWIGNEYLQLYPYIDKNYKSLSWDNNYTVIYPNGKKIDFVEWLKSN